MEILDRSHIRFSMQLLRETRFYLSLVVLTSSLLLTACSGDSDSSDDNMPSDVLADAGPDQFVQPGETVTLDGSLSESMSGAELSFAWSLQSVPENSTAVMVNANAVNPAFIADVEGTYIIELIVNEGTSANHIDTVTVNAAAFPVVETASNLRSPGVIPDGLLPRCFTNPDGTINNQCPVIVYNDISYWTYNFVDARFSLGIVGFNVDGKVAYNREVPTIRNIRRISVDEATETVTFHGESDSGDGQVTLTWLDLTSGLFVPAPEAEAGANQIYTPGDLVMLDGTNSYGATELTYNWSFISSPSGSTAIISDQNDQQPTFVADLAGSYVVQLVVNDGLTDSIADTVIITSSNIPLVGSAPAANPPGEIPEGLKVSCFFSPLRFQNPNCPVLLYNDLTYWPYSYRDNRFALAIVAYDAAGNIVSEQELTGPRSVWQITVDVDASTVSFYGGENSQNFATLTWLELTP